MVMLTVAGFVSAQDVIITIDSKKIEAKILEVSQTEIKYKEKTNPNGPTFVLATSEINTIIYENGSVSTFNHAQKSATLPSTNGNADTYNQSQFVAGTPITRSDKTYYMGDQHLTEDQYAQFVQKNCTQAYEAFTRGKKLRKTGYQLLASGLPIFAAGIVFYGVGVGVGTSARDESMILGLGIPGAVMMGVGSGLTIASIPCIVVGTVRRNNSHEIYNTNCARPVTLQFDVKAQGTGLGLAMRF